MPLLFGRFARTLLSHRGVAIALFAGVCAVVGLGVLRLEVDFSASGFFGSGGDAGAKLKRFTEQWGHDDGIVVAVVQRNDRGLMLDAETLARVHTLTQHIGAVPQTGDAVSLTNFAVPRLVDGALEFRPVTDVLPSSALGWQAWRARVLNDDLVTPQLVSEAGDAMAIVIELAVDADDIGAMRPVLREIELVSSGLEGLDVSLAGTPVVRTALLDLILTDQSLFVPLAFLLMAVLLGVLFRRFHGVLLPLLGAALPSAMVMGVMGYSGEPIGVVNQVYFTLLPVIAVSGGIHLLSRYYEEAERSRREGADLRPQDRAAALVATLRAVGGACFFSAATTMIGLLSLQASPMHVLRGFGVYSAVGVLFAFATLIVLVPLILSATRARTLDSQWQRRESRIDAVLERAAQVPLGAPKRVAFGAIILLVVSLALGVSVPVRNHLSGMLEHEHPVSTAGRLLDDKLGGQLSIEVDLQGPPGAFTDPAVLSALHRFETEATKIDGVKSAVGPATFLARVNAAISGDEAGPPASRNAAAQLLFLVEGNPALDRFFNGDRSRSRVTLRMADIGGQRFEQVATQVHDDLTERLTSIATGANGVHATVTGTALTSYLGLNRLVRDLVKSVSFAFLVIIVVLGVIFRSPRIALLCLVPNMLPQTLGLALLAILGWPLQPGTAVIFTIALGIAVDDTIHLLVRRREERAAGRGRDEAIRRAMVRSGRPVVITTLILCAGFSVNGLSSFPTNSMAGALGAFVIFVALLGDVFLLPAFLSLWGGDAGAAPAPESTSTAPLGSNADA